MNYNRERGKEKNITYPYFFIIFMNKKMKVVET